jgi:hypothetical protein
MGPADLAVASADTRQTGDKKDYQEDKWGQQPQGDQ